MIEWFLDGWILPMLAIYAFTAWWFWAFCQVPYMQDGKEVPGTWKPLILVAIVVYILLGILAYFTWT